MSGIIYSHVNERLTWGAHYMLLEQFVLRQAVAVLCLGTKLFLWLGEIPALLLSVVLHLPSVSAGAAQLLTLPCINVSAEQCVLGVTRQDTVFQLPVLSYHLHKFPSPVGLQNCSSSYHPRS